MGTTKQSSAKRRVMMQGDVIKLRRLTSDGQPIERTVDSFCISKVRHQGNVMLCYDALNQKTGVCGQLKEFYPVKSDGGDESLYGVKRNAENQLVIATKSAKWFRQAVAAYKEECGILSHLREVTPGAAPFFELYEGRAKTTKQATTVYMWIPDERATVSFASYLDTVKEDLQHGRYAEHHMFNILSSLHKLTCTVYGLHNMSLVHGHLTPETFTVGMQENGEVESERLTLLDSDAMYADGKLSLPKAVCDGFYAPERENGEVTKQSDIYAIGAVLFYALLKADETAVQYRPELYDQLPQLVSQAKLICCSDKNSQAALLDKLLYILKKALASNPKDRYASCKKLKEDLFDARAFLLTEEARAALKKQGRDLHTVDIEASLDTETNGGVEGALQRLLFERPLYTHADAEGQLDVLVLGGGSYATKFVDLALEMCQIPSHTLRVAIVSKDRDLDRERYLKARPAFTSFYTVEGVNDGLQDPYGTVKFLTTGADGNSVLAFESDEQVNAAIFKNVEDACEGYRFSYVFVALGDDDLNRDVALAYRRHIGAEAACDIQYMCYDGATAAHDGVRAVSVSDTIALSPDYDALKRMTLNVHLLWENSLNVDFRAIRDRFADPYHFYSSFSNVLSIKYKLHGMGIDLSDTSGASLLEASRQFIGKSKKQPLLNKLAMYEHRRWVTNYICRGWQQLTQFSALATDRKNPAVKRHPCIVRSGESWTLSSDKWQQNQYAKWDTLTDEELRALDPLDQVSVKLHRHFVNKAKEVSDFSKIQKYINIIRTRVEKYPEVSYVFEKYYLCLHEIFEGQRKQTRMYDKRREVFLKHLENLSAAVTDDVKEALAAVDKKMYPLLQSKRYLDYKANDQKLIRNIPFILTYSVDLHLCVPFDIESEGEHNNRVLFGNVAAARAVNPSQITYVLEAETIRNKRRQLLRGLQYAVNCFEDKKMQTKIHLLFLSKDGGYAIDDELKGEIHQLSGNTSKKRIGAVETLSYENDEQLQTALEEYFVEKQRDPKTAFTALEQNETGISKLLRGFGCYRLVPSYTYDMLEKRFYVTEAEKAAKQGLPSTCWTLFYVPNNDRLTVADMCYFSNEKNESKLPELKEDYMFFWDLYKFSWQDQQIIDKERNAATPPSYPANPYGFTNNNWRYAKERTWKSLCKALSDRADKDAELFKVSHTAKNATPEALINAVLYVPTACCAALRKIVNAIMAFDKDVVRNVVFVYHDSATTKVTLRAIPYAVNEIEKLIEQVVPLSDESKIEAIKAGDKLVVNFDGLHMKGLAKSKITPQMQYVLDQLRDPSHRYLLNYRETVKNGESFVEFTYASHQIKSMLTVEGKVFEIYVYYKMLEKDFDEVCYSCEMVWNNDDVKHEFDIVAIKGQKALLIELKATYELKQEMYYRLAELNRHFGINSIPVLVADTCENPTHDHEANDRQRSRGAELGVTTVYKRNDIIGRSNDNSHIGDTLLKLLK